MIVQCINTNILLTDISHIPPMLHNLLFLLWFRITSNYIITFWRCKIEARKI